MSKGYALPLSRRLCRKRNAIVGSTTIFALKKGQQGAINTMQNPVKPMLRRCPFPVTTSGCAIWRKPVARLMAKFARFRQYEIC